MADTASQRERVVLSCVDASSVSAAVCDYAVWIAATIGAPLRLLHTIEHSRGPAVADLSGAIGLGSREELLDELATVEQTRSKLLIKSGQLMLQAASERAVAAGADRPETCQRHGSLAEALVELEDELRVVVMGIRGEAHERDQAGVGAQLETVVRALHKPLLVVNTTYQEPRRVMLAYNGSKPSRKALRMVASSLLFRKIPCHVVYAGSNGRALLDEAAGVLRDAGLEAITAQLSGRIEDALSNYQAEHDIDLTVMGAFSHSRIRGFLVGSFTSKMLAATQRPLLLLR